jgi:protein-tyrosine kinase
MAKEMSEIVPEMDSTSFSEIEAASTKDFVNQIVMLTHPEGTEAEAIRGLRTRVMAQHVREGRRALAICTPTEGTGASFVAANLAASLAQIGVKTVVVDTNLRTPRLTALFGQSNADVGLGNYLADPSITIDAVVNETTLSGLSIITAGSQQPNPQELLSGARFKGLVDVLLREFDFTIFATSPTSNCTDAQRVATVAGYTLIVARKHDTHMKDITTLANMLRADRAIIVGTVLNNF